MIEFLLGFSGATPYVLIFVILLACGLGVPIPEDITLFAAGVLAFYGEANVHVMVALSMLGVLLGDSMIFYMGSHYGRRLTKVPPFNRFLSPERLDAVQKKMHEQGNRLIFAARFMPGLRAPIYFTAGTLHLPYRIFLFYDGIAALISVPLIIYTVYHFGEELDHVVKLIRRVENSILIGILLVIGWAAVKWYRGHQARVAEGK